MCGGTQPLDLYLKNYRLEQANTQLISTSRASIK